MHAAAAHFASLMEDAEAPDVVLTTDMCDVAQLRGLMPSSWSRVRMVTMFHENQLTFPWSPTDSDVASGRDQTYAYLNLSSALASDQVWFNSEHHRTAFLSAAQGWMKRMPKPHIPALAERIGAKSQVMHLGLDFTGWDELKPPASRVDPNAPPVILWNHRWSWDKGAEAFVRFVNDVLQAELPASFVILGEGFERRPEGWDAMKDKLGTAVCSGGMPTREMTMCGGFGDLMWLNPSKTRVLGFLWKPCVARSFLGCPTRMLSRNHPRTSPLLGRPRLARSPSKEAVDGMASVKESVSHQSHGIRVAPARRGSSEGFGILARSLIQNQPQFRNAFGESSRWPARPTFIGIHKHEHNLTLHEQLLFMSHLTQQPHFRSWRFGHHRVDF